MPSWNIGRARDPFSVFPASTTAWRRAGPYPAGLLEEMRGTRDDGQPRHGRHPLHGFAIDLDDLLIVSADDEQRRRSHERKGVTGKIGSAAARHDGLHAIRALRC